MSDVKVVAQIQVDAGDTSSKIEGVKKQLNETGDAAKKLSSNSKEVGGNFANLKENLTSVSPAAAKASEGLGVFNQGLNMIKANPIVAVLAGLAAVVIGLFQKMRQMDGASDALAKSWASLSTIFNKFLDKILTPMIDAFTFLIDGVTSLATSIADFFSPGLEEAAERSGELRNELNDLEDAQKNNSIAVSEATLKLAEARDMAADSTLTTKERVKALQEAAKIEKEQAEQVYQTNLAIYKNRLEQMAMEMNVRQDLINTIKNGTVEQLKAARAEMLTMKNVNGDKLLELDNYLKQAIESQSKSQKIQTKTEKSITALYKEEEAKRKEQADKAKAQRDKEQQAHQRYLELKNKISKESHLAEITDAEMLAKAKALNEEKAKIKEVDALKVSEQQKKELRTEIHKNTLNEIAKITKEFEDKEAKRIEDEAKKKAEAEAKALDEKNKRIEDIQTQHIADLAKKKEEQEKAIAEVQKVAKEIVEGEMTPEQLELTKLEETYQKKLAIIQGNETLVNQLTSQYEEQRAAIRNNYLNAQLNEVQSVGNKIVDVIGKQTVVGKGIGVANALINTYQGATDALRAKSTLPSPFDVVAKVANVAAILASGFKSVKAITSVQVPGASGGGGSVPNIAASAPILPQQTSTSLDAASIQGIGNAAGGGTNRAYVLNSDVKDSAERQAQLNRAARLN